MENELPIIVGITEEPSQYAKKSQAKHPKNC